MDNKNFLCKKGHILGVIRNNGEGVPQLLVLRHAVDLQAESPAEVDILGALEGRMPVQCDVPGCGEVKLWEASAEVIAYLFARLNEERLEAVLKKIRIGNARAREREERLARMEVKDES